MILITGARGFIGKYLIKELSKTDLSVFLTTSDKKACGEKSGYLFHYLNLTEKESLKNIPENIDTVIHLAAAIPEKNKVVSFAKFMDVNASGTRKLMEAVAEKGCKQFIYASTQMVVEKPFYLPVDENHPLVPISDYGLSKAIGEKYCLSCAEALKINMIALRFAQIYGAGEHSGFVLTNFIERAINRLPLTVYGQGKIRRDLLCIKDAVRAIIFAINSKVSGVYNIGSGKGVSIKELAEIISEVFSDGASRIEFKNKLKEEGEDFYMNIKKAQREINFSPKYGLKEGLLDYKIELLKRH